MINCPGQTGCIQHSEGYQNARKSLRWEMCFADSILFMPKWSMTLDYTYFILNCRQWSDLWNTAVSCKDLNLKTCSLWETQKEKSKLSQRMTNLMFGFKSCVSALIYSLMRAAQSGVYMHLPRSVLLTALFLSQWEGMSSHTSMIHRAHASLVACSLSPLYHKKMRRDFQSICDWSAQLMEEKEKA